jgi:hypothetical protein
MRFILKFGRNDIGHGSARKHREIWLFDAIRRMGEGESSVKAKWRFVLRLEVVLSTGQNTVIHLCHGFIWFRSPKIESMMQAVPRRKRIPLPGIKAKKFG